MNRTHWHGSTSDIAILRQLSRPFIENNFGLNFISGKLILMIIEMRPLTVEAATLQFWQKT